MMQNENSRSALTILPPEIWVEILMYLTDTKELFKMCRFARDFDRLILIAIEKLNQYPEVIIHHLNAIDLRIARIVTIATDLEIGEIIREQIFLSCQSNISNEEKRKLQQNAEFVAGFARKSITIDDSGRRHWALDSDNPTLVTIKHRLWRQVILGILGNTVMYWGKSFLPLKDHELFRALYITTLVSLFFYTCFKAGHLLATYTHDDVSDETLVKEYENNNNDLAAKLNLEKNLPTPPVQKCLLNARKNLFESLHKGALTKPHLYSVEPAQNCLFVSIHTFFARRRIVSTKENRNHRSKKLNKCDFPSLLRSYIDHLNQPYDIESGNATNNDSSDTFKIKIL